MNRPHNGFAVEIGGPFALFTRPEAKIERISYEVPPESAVRGMLEAIYWHPGVRYVIESVEALRPVRWQSMSVNGVKGKGASVERVQMRQQLLADVLFRIRARIEVEPGAQTPADKAWQIFCRRAAQGQSYRPISLGTRECLADTLRLVEPEPGDVREAA